MKKHLLLSLALIAGTTLSAQSSALTSDKDQPAQVEADETEVNFKTGVRTLTNNVLVVQGTLRIKADKLVATYKGSELITAVADGSLARFKQRPDGQPNDVEGSAKKILVDHTKNTITLIGKAALKQGGTTATGNEIVYNMVTDKLRIKGGSNLNSAGKAGNAKPQPKLEDPFKDEVPSPATATVPSTAADPIAPEATAAPAKAGRSRLILQPKKKK